MKRKIEISLIVGIILTSFLIIFFSSNAITQENTELPKTADSQQICVDEWAEANGYADNHIGWSYSTNPSISINVWALKHSEYVQFIYNGFATGYQLSTGSSGSGTWSVPYGDTWHIIFWNDISSFSLCTKVSYQVSFVGDSRPPTIDVKEPDSSSSYQADSDLVVEWTSINVEGNIEIELFNSSSLYTTISASTDNDGTYTWHIPQDCPDGTEYNVKVSSISYPSAYDFSEHFTIETPKSITVLNPTYSTVVSKNSNYTISWETTGLIPFVQIELYNQDTLVECITLSTENDGEYVWQVSASYSDGNDYRIVVADVSDPYQIYDYSDYFTIDNPNDLMIPGYNFGLILSLLIVIGIISKHLHLKKINSYEE
jgi:hypothetical protein